MSKKVTLLSLALAQGRLAPLEPELSTSLLLTYTQPGHGATCHLPDLCFGGSWLNG